METDLATNRDLDKTCDFNIHWSFHSDFNCLSCFNYWTHQPHIFAHIYDCMLEELSWLRWFTIPKHRWAPTPYSCKWSTTASVWNLVSAKDNRHGGHVNAGGFSCWYSNFESDVLHRWCFGTCLLSYCRYRSSKSPMSIDWETGSKVHTSETEN